jgi:hypothetical protein
MLYCGVLYYAMLAGRRTDGRAVNHQQKSSYGFDLFVSKIKETQTRAVYLDAILSNKQPFNATLNSEKHSVEISI